MFLITGITGQVGGATARRLLEEGRTVRALVRDPQKATEWSQKGVEVRQGDFNDPAAVAAALEGVEGAYLMLPPLFLPSPGFPEARVVIASFREALRQSPPPRLVVLSSVGSQQTSGLGNITSTHLLEEALSDLPFPTAFLRPGSFLENYLPSLKAAASTGRFDTYFTPTNRPIPVAATEDIGREAARLLSSGWQGQKFVEVGTRISSDELAQAMSEVLGRPVTAHFVARDQWSATLEARGMPAGRTNLFEEMEDAYNSGWIDFGVPGTETVAGTTTPAEVFMRARLDQRKS